VYYRHTIGKGISVFKNHNDTIIWLKLDKDLFQFDDDVYLCGVYLWGADSPAYNVVNVDLFDVIQADIDELQELGSVYILGDLNSRVGLKNDFISYDVMNNYTDDEDYIPDTELCRDSVDRVSNAHGVKLLDLCKATGVRIANGRIGQSNSYTFVNQSGASVIDYLLLKESDFVHVKEFSVESLTEWSDHCPLSLTLCCNEALPVPIVQNETRFKWNSDHIDTFRIGLIGKLPDFNHLTDNIDVNNRSSVNDLINGFTDIVRSVADPLFRKHHYNSGGSKFCAPSI
jgi:hypothetical protein